METLQNLDDLLKLVVLALLLIPFIYGVKYIVTKLKFEVHGFWGVPVIISSVILYAWFIGKLFII